MDETLSPDCLTCVDAHVHIHDCFDLETFLDSAFSNFKKEAMHRGRGISFAAVLLLTETAGDDWFGRLKTYDEVKHGQAVKTISHWSFHPTDEICSLRACESHGGSLYIIAGRQIVTLENLELLALATTESFEDGSPIKELIKAVKQSGGIPVIPWGFGKWAGKRGTIVENILRGEKDSLLFLGDNGGRPAILPRPRLFEIAEKNEIRILSGSDPLPFPFESCRAGSFGFSIPGTIARECPTADLKRLLLNPKTPFHPYGNLERPYRFFRNQLAMQIRKRSKRKKN